LARVLLFGRLADIAGWREREVEGASIIDLRTRLSTDDPGLGEALSGPGVQVAVDQEIVRGDAAIAPRAEVAFLPPMSGG
jgi:molybdopterin synthase sulfur carrier subunit